ncbi:MAG: class C sortase [Ruminococcaceae bacterium]|nr:class C sortase [Oscillospiraceae bacterium]
MKKKHKWSTIILLAIFFVGLSVLLYPSITSYWNSRTQSQAIIDYEKMLEAIPEADYSSEFARADEYNAALRELESPLIQHKQVDGYMDILNLGGTGIMGYISIEKIGLELPVYHTTSDTVLSVAVGHLEGTSIPTGGTGTHSVLSAHRGLPSATLFTHLDHMELGDTFTITILDRVLTYQVDQIKTITPDNVNDIKIDPEGDYCTLLTCTPYGINTHRLLVRGQRIETVSQKNIYVISDAYQIDVLIVMPAVAIPMLLILMVIVLAMPVKKDDLEDFE